jgi:hypothetical protein
VRSPRVYVPWWLYPAGALSIGLVFASAIVAVATVVVAGALLYGLGHAAWWLITRPSKRAAASDRAALAECRDRVGFIPNYRTGATV